ncbi:hypothetical protein [Brevundimonas sp. DC300-4]|uniref:hypothetical protein n=1 Tax=Brevundimonas sp. DC300-4 TaxID=2804594 RepID=UPI003CF46A9B
MLHPIIFKKDTRGRTRVWQIEQDGTSYRVLFGIKNNPQTPTGWIHCIGKQARNDLDQAGFEIASAYEHQLDREYHKTEATLDEPKFFQPMLAGKYSGFSPGFAQPKLDGIRCIARVEGLFTREGQSIDSAPHIYETLRPLFIKEPDIIIDGELYNHSLFDDFNAIVSLVRRKTLSPQQLTRSAEFVEYHVYDLPSHAGSFSERSQALLKVVEGLPAIVAVQTEAIQDEQIYDELHGSWIENGYEGSMWRADAAYEQKRSKTLLKRKEFQDAEFRCLSIDEGVGHWAGLAKSVQCALPDGRTFRAGIKGSQARAKELLHESHLVVTVKYFHLTPDGIPRFPVVTKFWGEERGL